MSQPLFDLIRESGEECLCGHYKIDHAEEKVIFKTIVGDFRPSAAPRRGGCLSTLHGSTDPCPCVLFQPETGILGDGPLPGEREWREAAEESRNYRARANEWIAANPAAWSRMIALALTAADLKTPFGIGEICERVRWHFKTNQVAGENFKISNSLRAYFIRRMIAQHPEIAPFVKLKPVRH